MGTTIQFEDLMQALNASPEQRSRLASLLPAAAGEVVVEFRRRSEVSQLDSMAQLLSKVNSSLESVSANIQRGFADTKAQLVGVTQEFHEIRTAKARLEQMQGENLFRCFQEIDAQSFRIFCAILVHGDAAKAARALSMSDPRMRQILRSWRKRGRAYLGLLELVQWRKERKIVGNVPFNDALKYDQTDKSARENILTEVLDAVLSMTDGNWQEICSDLESLLRTAMGHSQKPAATATPKSPATQRR